MLTIWKIIHLHHWKLLGSDCAVATTSNNFIATDMIIKHQQWKAPQSLTCDSTNDLKCSKITVIKTCNFNCLLNSSTGMEIVKNIERLGGLRIACNLYTQ